MLTVAHSATRASKNSCVLASALQKQSQGSGLMPSTAGLVGDQSLVEEMYKRRQLADRLLKIP